MTEQDFELFSAYLDGDLSDADRAALEARLAAEPELRRELEALRQTVALVRSLPELKAPRSYALTAAALAQAGADDEDEAQQALAAMPANVTRLPAASRGRRQLSWLGAAAAVTLMFVIVGALLLNSQRTAFEDGAAVAIMVTNTAAPTQPVEMTQAQALIPETRDASAPQGVPEGDAPADAARSSDPVDPIDPVQAPGEQEASADQAELLQAVPETSTGAGGQQNETDLLEEAAPAQTFSVPGADSQTQISDAADEPPALFMIVPTATQQAFESAPPAPLPTQTAKQSEATPTREPLGGAARQIPTASPAATGSVDDAGAPPGASSQEAPPSLESRLVRLIQIVLRVLARLSTPE
jgi:anti-sigma factor RsiW